MEARRLTTDSVMYLIARDSEFVQNKMYERQYLCQCFNTESISLEKAQEYCENHPKIRLWYKKFPGKAFIVSRKDKVFIVINEEYNTPEREFEHRKLLLHEIGHFLLHSKLLRGGALLSERADRALEQIEREATVFSLIGIIPESFLRQAEQNGVDLKDYMQRRFRFSKKEAEMRLLGFDSELVCETEVF